MWLTILLLHLNLNKLRVLNIVQVSHFTVHIPQPQKGVLKMLLSYFLKDPSLVIDLVLRFVDIIIEPK